MEMLKKIESLEQERFRGNDWLNENIKEGRKAFSTSPISGRMEYGRLYSFKYYDPKTKDRLAYYNTNPLVIKIDEAQSKDGPMDVGLNLNFFPDQVKRQFIDVYWSRYKGLYESTTRRGRSAGQQQGVSISYDTFISMFKSYGAGFCIRNYQLSRMTDGYVFSNDINTWASAMLIKYPRFRGIGVMDRDKLFAEYINKLR